MARFFIRTHRTVALSPGTVEYSGAKKVEKVRISIMDYDEASLNENRDAAFEECIPCKDTPSTSWINVNGLHDTDLLVSMGERFNLHSLVLEDIVNTNQRPKLENYDNSIYIVIKMLDYDDTTRIVSSEQVSVVLGPNYVLSFQEREGDIFEPVRERIRGGKGRMRKSGADYLAYAIIDAVVDHYYTVLEKFGDDIESIEEDLVDKAMPELLHQIHALKREMIYIRKSIWPLREVVGGMERDETPLIKKATRVFLRDVYDHTIQVIDSVESFRDIISSMQDLYLSSMSNRMNEVMKVLTIAATIFVPLTFIAGIYGMNFEFMPELKWKWSYPVLWIVFFLVGGGMAYSFKRRRWF